MNETLSSTTQPSEARLLEQALIIDAVCEAIAEFGREAFAKTVPESQMIHAEAALS